MWHRGKERLSTLSSILKTQKSRGQDKQCSFPFKSLGEKKCFYSFLTGQPQWSQNGTRTQTVKWQTESKRSIFITKKKKKSV